MIKYAFKDFFNIEVKLEEGVEKELVYYLEIRHVLVHKSEIIDKHFVGATETMKANLKGYKENDHVELGADDWARIRVVFTDFDSEVFKN